MAYRCMKERKNRYAVKETAGLLGASRGAYYQRVRNGASKKGEAADAELVRHIREIAERHIRRHGSPQVRRELMDAYGKRADRKKAARLMGGNGLNAGKRRKFIRTTDSKHAFGVCGGILNREFRAEGGGATRVSGIACLRAENGWAYLTAVLDLFGRKTIGRATSAGMETTHAAVAALAMAFKNRQPQGAMVFHSDRGAQYCAQSFRDILRERCLAVRQSMSRKGNCRGNARAESFFKTLKRELETLGGKHSEAEARQPTFLCIEAYYNRIRMHSALGYVAPNMFYLGKAA